MNSQYLFKSDIIISQKIIIQDISDQTILMIQRSSTQTSPEDWDLPGGCVSYGENLQESIVREVVEEVNLVVNEIKIFNTYIHYSEDKCGINLGYIGAVNKKEITIILSPEHSNYKWVDINHAISLAKRPNISNHLNAYLKSNNDK